TGRDGCGGATGSSKGHTQDSMAECGSEVQKGNPPTERKLQRLFKNSQCSRIIKRCNDFGAGGVSVAVSELADGVNINLDNLLKKYEGLNGTELAISESQERMAVVVSKENEPLFIELAAEENLEATSVAIITEEKKLIMTWRGDTIVNIKRSFLNTNGITQYADVFLASPSEKKPVPEANFLDIFDDINICSQKGLVEKFDSTIGAGTVLMPFGGKYQLTQAEAMAAKIPVPNADTDTVSLMSYGFDPYLSTWSPFHGEVYAITDSISKIIATGGAYENIRLSFQEYFERLGGDPKKWGKPFAALLGAVYAQINLGIPAIGGKDSMSGSFMDLNVPPTLISFAVSTTSAKNIISPEFKKAGSKIVKLSTPYDENEMPIFPALIKNLNLLATLIKNKKVISAHTIGFGGIAASVSKMCMGNKIGAEIKSSHLFDKSYGSFILEFDGNPDEYNLEVIGQTIECGSIKINNDIFDLNKVIKKWAMPLEDIFPTAVYKKYDDADLNIELYESKEKKHSAIKHAKPKVLIPVFPGTNCEIDSKYAFEKAGACAEIFVLNNLTLMSFEQSIKEMAEKINNSQIIMFPGGFSAGDEPEGSGKFISAVFRNPYLKESVLNLLYKRDGLALGICNGFQALIKLGLLPYGKIELMANNSPTLTFNKIGRHSSTLVRTKIISNKSPWLNGVNAGDIHTVVVSHGEGRFICGEDTLSDLIKNKQIATQYVDFSGYPSYNIEYNPNYSIYAVEGLTSPDGRILGKMCHPERVGPNLYKNILGDYDQKIFESGVSYFS
ncbi:MAG: phosphoribosylformylglycinamidine synthase, partial [Clostridiales bacterium]|nr:phosphoribosylformylglycinamidine synthase [Clostridiales bacterium]